MTELARSRVRIDWQVVKERLAGNVIGSYGEADLERIFRERAIALAVPLQLNEEARAATHLACRVGSLKVLLPLTHTRRIVRPGWVAAVPSAPAAISRIVHLDGRIVAVVDLARVFDVPSTLDASQTLLVLLGSGNDRVAVAVDSAHGLSHVDLSALAPASGHAGASSELVLGLGPKLELVLDAGRLITGLEPSESSHVR